MSTPMWVTTTRGASVGTATIEESDDTFTLTAHGRVNGEQVVVASLSGGATSVLVVDAPYFVANSTVNTFQLRPSPGAPVMTFTADGGCAVYQVAGMNEPQALRNSMAGLIARGDASGGFNARSGVFPNDTETSHVTTSGMNWTTADLVAAVRHSTGGMYIVAHPTETGPITAADPSQPRIDALDLQIQDGAIDSTGFTRGRIVYTAGSPAAVPVAPGATSNSERLATWTVAAGATSTGTPTTPRFTVARGGIVPAANSTAYPGPGGRHKGLPVWDMSTNTLLINTTAGSTYAPIASVDSFKSVRLLATTTRATNSASFTAETSISTVVAPVETGKVYRIKWVVDATSTVSGDSARCRIREDSLAGTERALNNIALPTAGLDYSTTVEAHWTAVSTGNKTFHGTCQRISGTGNIACNANANQPSYLTVEYVSG